MLLDELENKDQENDMFKYYTIRKRRRASIRRSAQNEDVSRHSKIIIFLTDGKFVALYRIVKIIT